MRVTFWKLVEERRSTWEALRGKRTRVPGTPMALGRGDLPHDLAQLVVEGSLGLSHGFWGCVAKGATFRSLGRKRNRPGMAIIAEHRAELAEAEQAAGEHLRRWKDGRATPAADKLAEVDAAWRGLGDGGHLVIDWPTLTLTTNDGAGIEPTR